MFSGMCKRETGPHHAHIIQTVLNATTDAKEQNNTTYRTVSIASDGEAKRGDALVILTMGSQLSASLPIYKQLSPLQLMNYLVGPDNLTADKDYKHILKHQHNLLMCTKGVLIQGFCVTLAMLRLQLESNGINIFFCVAKVKADNLHGLFYLILLGTDHLETFFGLIRTAVGTDANVDLLQLGSHASGLTEVAAILAEHPEWDTGTRRLTLPQTHGEISSNIDHITPKDWHGNSMVGRVNLHTCWLLGRQEAVDCLPDAGPVFKQLLADESADIDILSPLGTLLVNRHNGSEDLGEDNLNNFIPEHPYDTPPPLHATELANNANTSLPYTHKGNLEDVMANEMP
jgi:hypothetical protein